MDTQAQMDPVAAARLRLLLHPLAEFAFFGHLAMRLKLQPTSQPSKALVIDGETLVYHPETISSYGRDFVEFLLAQALLHCIFGHHTRRQGRHAGKWQIACTMAVHSIMKKTSIGHNKITHDPSKLGLPDDQTAEFYYERLPDEEHSIMQGITNIAELTAPQDIEALARKLRVIVHDAAGEPGLQEGQSTAASEYGEAAWKLAACRSEQYAKKRGTLPGELSSVISEPIRVPVDYQSLLCQFMLKHSGRDNVDWSLPSRRSHTYGIYLPSRKTEGLQLVVIFVDTSGSMSEDEELRHCAGQIEAMLSFCNCEAYIVQHDAAVQTVLHWIPGDGPLAEYIFKGRGGTSHVPAWQWLKESQLSPDIVIAITDGYTDWGKDPGVPVLWILTPSSTAEAPPFGQVVRLPKK